MATKLFRTVDGTYNMLFDTVTGQMERWGRTVEEDPILCPVGPEIADIEISTVCNGIRGTPCSWCYKSNTGIGKNMTLDTFTRVLSSFPQVLTQVALGIGDIDANQDLFPIMQHCRDQSVVPNLTINGAHLSGWHADRLARLAGAVAVSHYGEDDVCFGAVEDLTNRGLAQVNIHKLLAASTLASCHKLIDAAAEDTRLKKLRAIVFLLLKPKGLRNRLAPIQDAAAVRGLYDHARERGIGIGLDSCSAPLALKTWPEDTHVMVEPCESGLFSIYVNVDGEAFPCSFTEGTPGWETGIDLVNFEGMKVFAPAVWHGQRLTEWREKLLASSAGCKGCSAQKLCRACPAYPITPCKEAS